MRAIRPSIPSIAAAALGAALLAAASTAPAGAATVTYILRDLVFTGSAGQNGMPSGFTIGEPGIDGHLVWTYTPGDFANGTGVLTDLLLPLTSFPFSQATLTVDPTGITGTQVVNTQNLTYDFQITFRPSLTDTMHGANVDPSASTFDFTGTYWAAPGVGFNGEWLGSISSGSVVPASAVLDAGPGARAGCALGAASPNPFRAGTTLDVHLSRSGPARLAIFATDGRRVATLLDGAQPAGDRRVEWDGRDGAGRRAPAGIYFARLDAAEGGLTRRIVRIE